MTHNERVLSLLKDGKPHTHMEGYRLGVMLHSRAADLRKQGHDIRCWRDGDFYLYQLLTKPGNGERALSESGSYREEAPPFLGSVSSFPATSYERPEAQPDTDGGQPTGHQLRLENVA